MRANEVSNEVSNEYRASTEAKRRRATPEVTL